MNNCSVIFDGSYWRVCVQIQLVPRFDLCVRKQASDVVNDFFLSSYQLGMFAIRSRRKVATEKDFLEAVNKVIKAYAKFSSTPKYMTYN